MKRFLLMLVIILLSSCSNPSNKFTLSKTSELNSLKNVEVWFNSGPEPYGEENEFAFVIRIKNNETFDLSSCILVLDDKYYAELKDLQCSAFLGTGKLKSNALKKKTKIELIFSHDVGNFSYFKEKNGKTLSNKSIPRRLKIKCDQGTGEWFLI
ncbi:MAG: hypothetical protein A3I43_04035 [Omnitrophica WOR_2 bacterium RIFCSPLOWO2_02_FULL_50_19]|nr:MAG: hypothetical protein A3I43_04035 [Omnitrophica WOR_2 bacterium RIFCSPLOWO2_02_FULL_50_19]